MSQSRDLADGDATLWGSHNGGVGDCQDWVCEGAAMVR